MNRRRPFRLPREQYVGLKTVSYTICVEDRAPIFTCERTVRSLEEILRVEVEKHGCRSPVYCFMPDHIHLLVQGNVEDADLLTPVEKLKLRGGLRLKTLKAAGKFQASFYDHIVRSSEDWRGQAMYIALNPVRAGLVDDPLEYPFTGVIGEDRREMLLEIFLG